MNTKMFSLLSAAIISAGVAIGGFFIGHGIELFRGNTHYVSVKGLAEKTVLADEAIWTLNIETSNDNLNTLYTNMDSAQHKVIAFLQENGFKRDQIHLNPIVISDYANQPQKIDEKITRYRASDTITATCHDVKKIRSVIEKTNVLLQKGVILTSTDAQYRFTKLNDIKPQMLNLATTNARSAAQQFAINSNSTLGKIRYASQGQFSITSADGSYGDQDPLKKIRVVTSVQYDLK